MMPFDRTKFLWRDRMGSLGILYFLINVFRADCCPAWQSGAAENLPDARCGVYCLFVGLKALDIDVPKFAEFEKTLGPVPAGGFSMGALAAAAERAGAHTLGVSTTIANLGKREQKFACIAIVHKNHFVNVAGFDEATVKMIDPSSPIPAIQSVPRDAWGAIWDGTALLIAKEPLLPEESLPRDLNWKNILGYLGLGLGVLLILFIVRGAARKRRSPAAVFIIAGVSICAAGCGAGQADGPSTGPRIRLSEYAIDLGKIPVVIPGSHDVSVQVFNDGDAPLVIDRADISCSCMDATVPGGPIAPGESETIVCALDARNAGENSASVALVSNDQTRPQILVRFSWETVPPISFDPATVDFGHMLYGKRVQREVTLTFTSEMLKAGAGILGTVTNPAESLSAVLLKSETVDQEQRTHWLVELAATGEVGPRIGSFRVDTGSSDQPTVDLPVFWHLHWAIESTPSLISLGVVAAGESKKTTLILVAYDKLPLGKLSYQVQEDDKLNITAEIIPISETAARVVVACRAGNVTGIVKSKLVIQADGTDRRVEVPITSLVR